MASKVTHIARFAVQDWRTSKIRARSSTTQDPMLRTVYFEILLALYESGGRLPADPELLSDTLLLPAEEIARCLPILLKFGQSGRGGLQLQDSYIHNARVDEDLEEEKEYRLKQAERGRLRHQPALSQRSASAEPPLSNGSTGAETTVSQHIEPLSQPECALSLPLPLPPPSPLPLPSPLPTPNPSLFPEGESEKPPVKEPLGFVEFWEAYPRKVDKDKARRAWTKAKKASGWPGRDHVIAAVKAQAGTQKWRTEPEFIPYPSTWLNNGRWSDAVPSNGKALTLGFVNGTPVIPPAHQPISLRNLQREIQDIYREQFRAGKFPRATLDAHLVEIQRIEDRDELYKILDQLEEQTGQRSRLKLSEITAGGSP